HDTLLREAVATHGGTVFKTAGDRVCATFPTAPAALAAALAAQRALQSEPWGPTDLLRVRMALHTGTAEVRHDDYFGPPLNRVARILNAGHGGQILISLATTELVRDHLPPEVALRDLGTHRLKDLTRPEQIFQLMVADLPSEFPPLHTLERWRTNLPVQPTPLIGRDREVAAVCATFRRVDVRLVTLIGPGGVGKTRMGLQAAAELLDTFPDGVYFVALAPITDPALIAPTIAQMLGLQETGGRPLVALIEDYLRDKQLLLLLDNFEQVVVAAPLIAELLAAAPDLKLLVTSRAILHLSGEHVFPVPPLGLPDRQQLPTIERLSQYDAVALFIARARAARPEFQVTNDNAPAVAEICHRLDGLPLAIELAAARSAVLSPQALLVRLDQRLKLLTGGARDLPIRQQTLRDTIAWSYDLLDAAEQTLFARLAVFVGGARLEAAEAVTTLNVETFERFNVLDGLTTLAEQSLLRQDEGEKGEPHFVMLETIREYALERLEQSGEAQSIRRQHAIYYLALAERAKVELSGTEQEARLLQLAAEYDDLRAALAWALGGGDAQVGIRLALALAGPSWEVGRFWSGFWALYSYSSEGQKWLEQVAQSSAAAPAVQA
ncbi:MAG TPA: AAA family ATPase, partial [Roseiflexaceae bacterium]